MVHDASVRIDGLSVCAKALRSPAAPAVVWIWQRQRSPTLLSSSSPHHHCLLASSNLGHDAEDGVVATDAGPNLLIVLLGVAHLVELRLQHTHAHTFAVSTSCFPPIGSAASPTLTVDASMDPPNHTA